MNAINHIFIAEKISIDSYERLGLFRNNFYAFLACMIDHRRILKDLHDFKNSKDFNPEDELDVFCHKNCKIYRIKELREYRISLVNIHDDILSYIKKRYKNHERVNKRI